MTTPNETYPYHTVEYATDDDGTEVLPCKHCAPGKPCATLRGVFDPFPGTDAEMFIQWKGTEVCLDFHCPCGAHGHYDGGFAYNLECPKCGAIFELGTQVKARRLADGEEPGVVQLLEVDE